MGDYASFPFLARQVLRLLPINGEVAEFIIKRWSCWRNHRTLLAEADLYKALDKADVTEYGYFEHLNYW